MNNANCHFKILYLFIITIFLFFSKTLTAEELKIEFMNIDDNKKIIIHNSPTNDYNFKVDQNIMNITFNKDIEFNSNLADLISSSNNVIKDAHFDKDKNNFTIILDKNYIIKKFEGDNNIGFGLIESTKDSIEQGSSDNNSLRISSRKISENKYRWSFPWEQNVAASVFYLNNNLWIIFSAYQKIDNSEAKLSLWNSIKEISQLNSNSITILRYKLDIKPSIYVSKENNKWMIDFVQNDPVTYLPQNDIKQYLTPYSKGEFYPIANMANPVFVVDPNTASEITIIPIYNPDSGVSVGRKFSLYEILGSGQGFNVIKYSDSTKIDLTPNGVEIITPELIPKQTKNNILSDKSQSQNTDSQTMASYDSGITSLFPFREWKSFKDKDFTTTKDKLFDAIEEASVKDQPYKMIEMAKFYTAIGFYNESIGLLRNIETKYHDYALDNNQFNILMAGNLFLINRYVEANNYFDNIRINKLTETQKNEYEFWKKANHIALDMDADNPLFVMKYTNSFLLSYPKDLRDKFILLDVEKNIKNNNLRYASNLIYYALNLKTKQENINSLKYFTGEIYNKKHLYDDATAIWSKIVNLPYDNFNRLRAGFALTRLELSENKINIDQAIEKLSKYRYLWRGDSLEVEVLKYLSELYYSSGKYIDALRMWKELMTYFADSPSTFFLTSKMSKLFSDLYLSKDFIDKISDFDAVSLYYEFKELTPIGEKGDMLVMELARRFMKLDLLDEAEKLLTHQLKFRVSREEQYRLSNKVALLHLINKKPKEALEVLNAAILCKNAPEEIKTHQYLQANAQGQLGMVDDAMNTLSGDGSVEAESIRIRIYWSQKLWNNLIRMLTPKVAKMAEEKLPITKDDDQDLLFLAIAHVMVGNIDELRDLFGRFKDAVFEDPETRNLFLFFTKYETPDNYNEVFKYLENHGTNDFIEKYKEKLLENKPKELEKV